MSWDKDAACKRENEELMFPLSYAAGSPQVKAAKIGFAGGVNAARGDHSSA